MKRTLLTLPLLYTLAACGQQTPAPAGKTLSLTGYGFTGKKYYFGWAEYLDGFMGNETKYDVQHTHDIFTKDVGGGYESNRMTDREVGSGDIRGVWQALDQKVGAEDMYTQYSSGHGYEQGLGVGVTYDQMRDAALSLGAKETIIFTMACHSGGLNASFDKRKGEWQSFQQQGKTLFVMTSSRQDQLSSTGPGTDDDERGGPNGSAGSAFGHALWKSLIGYADGYVDGVKDGFITLGEVAAYAKWKTKQVGGHDPVVSGSYDPGLIINRVPPPRFFEELGLEETYEDVTEDDHGA